MIKISAKRPKTKKKKKLSSKGIRKLKGYKQPFAQLGKVHSTKRGAMKEGKRTKKSLFYRVFSLKRKGKKVYGVYYSPKD